MIYNRLVENDSTKEAEARSYTIDFIPGTHTWPFDFAQEQSARRLRENWYTSHTWNDVKSESISSVIAIDSLTPVWFYEENDRLKKVQDLQIWRALPEDPKDISNEPILVVAGDFLFDRAFIYDNSDEIFNKFKEDDDREFIESFMNRSGLGIISTAYIINKLRGSKGNKSASEDNEMSRRDFLKGAATTVAVALMAKSSLTGVLPSYATKASDKRYRDIALQVLDAINPDEFGRVEVDMRTALLAIKSEEAMRRVNMDKYSDASVVMGMAHAENAYGLVNSEERRSEIFYEYFEKVRSVSVWAESQFGIDSNEMFEDIANELSYTETYGVVQPDTDAEEHDINELHRAVGIVDSFYSPTIQNLKHKYMEENNMLQE